MSDLVQIEGQEIIRVFPYRTSFTPNDALAFVGYPPLHRPGTPKTPVHVSVIFKWWRAEAERIAATWRDHYETVVLGGPAYGDLGDEFTPGKYLKLGCTITSRGCVKHCGWCPEKDRPLWELPNIADGWIVQDSNLLACSETHVRKVFDMLRRQPHPAKFSGGLDKHFLKEWHRELFDSIRLDELWFACDLTSDLPQLEKAARILDGIPIDKKRCYAMIGYDHAPEILDVSQKRMERILELGFLPFCQLYIPDEGVKAYPKEWKDFQRHWARPASYRRKKEEPSAQEMLEFAP